ncbi:DUF6115 domain-containing protein [Aneurinibacillus migulanus]|uniref:DUF2802 domain-containing protein n=1 Tax=Aneurinibacillus migulanus TaxID=47500 RepID=A0A0D1XU02_ANEMI|nr:hypothetical protein [Aneurinibacillus migulanus]KIV55588.1 hypothetical protein TS65_14470 [Aneurinibacillus migulanus]KON95791.1 hypothetical protein AF333_10165 [Aneurinibacillus migulanus]MED0891866.1 hypothetical protein [Aneurinibacillus migulanus]MED1617394.1 hypothetical protein [Aneurinibacillus migulanus]SDI37733.1 hypothetical protein SAMN04487909_103262 [Aneurinibacillus migulanus]
MMTDIWLSALTIIVLLLALRLLKSGNGKQIEQEESAEGKFHTLITEFERENSELVRSIAQVKRMTDTQLTGVKEELASLQRQVGELMRQKEELLENIEQLQSSIGEFSKTTTTSTVAPLPQFLKDEYKDIPQLYAQGMSSLEIARKLGMGDGEVKIVIQMLKKQGFLAAE